MNLTVVTSYKSREQKGNLGNNFSTTQTSKKSMNLKCLLLWSTSAPVSTFSSNKIVINIKSLFARNF